MSDLSLVRQRAGDLRASLVEHVDVQIEAYLGGTRLKVAELNALQQGDAVTLDAPLNAMVALRVNGAVIAEGELVAVGDKFAVKIVSIAP